MNESLIDVNCSDCVRRVQANKLFSLVVKSTGDKEHLDFDTDRVEEQELLLDSLASIRLRYSHLTGYYMSGNVQISACFSLQNGIVSPQILWRFL